MSLSRLWQRQGRLAPAYKVLAEDYSGFTEGFDTADLQAAEALLDTATAEPDHAGLSPTGTALETQDTQQRGGEDARVCLPLQDEILGPL